ncbi:hypothetical protein PTKIN_Ptkin04bG0027200 [Pterospermum kingtungense]
MMGAIASGVPYSYLPMSQPPEGPDGMMIGRPAVDPTGCGVYVQPPSQPWQTLGAEEVGIAVVRGISMEMNKGIRNIC